MGDISAPKPGHISLVGRDHEQRLLLGGFNSACAGMGRLVLIGGEAGIGKTAIVEDHLRAVVHAGAAVLSGASYDVESPPPYGPWREALAEIARNERVAQSQTGWLSDEYFSSLPDQAALFGEVLARIRNVAESRPLVLVLEDVHWSDQESLDLLRYIGRSIRNDPVLVISTYRNDEIHQGHALYRLLPHLVREAKADRIDLRRFSLPAIEEMVDRQYRLSEEDRARLVSELAHRTQGNPFFISELLRSMEMNDLLSRGEDKWRLAPLTDIEIPLLVKQVIDRRIAELDERAQSGLRAAAVLGYDIQPDLWYAVTDLDESDLSDVVRQALDAHILEQSPRGSRLRFRHALVQETLYSSLPLPYRQSLHRRAASTLANLPDADPATVAEHYRHASSPEAANWSLEAARRARQLFAPHSVIQHLDPGYVPVASLTPAERTEIHQLLGWAHEISGQFEGAQQNYRAELDAAIETEDRYAEWDALIRLAGLWAGRDYTRTGDYVAKALELAEGVGDRALIGHSLNRMGNWHLNNENPEQAREFHLQALEIFEHIEHQQGIAATYDLLGMTCYMGGNVIEGTRHYQQAIDLFERLDNRQGLVSSVANYSMRGITYHTDMMTAIPTTLDSCITDAERALHVASGIEFRAGEVYARIRLGSALGSRGLYQRSIDVLNESIEQASEIRHWQWLTAAHCVISATYLDILNPELARLHLEQVDSLAEDIGSRHWIRFNSGISAMASLVSGNPDQAADRLHYTWTENVPAQTMAQRHVWHARIELELVRGNFEDALFIIDRVLGSTAYASRDRPAVQLSLLRARALMGLEEFAEAGAWLQPALEIAERQGALPKVWRILFQQAKVRTALGDHAGAAEKSLQANSIIEELGQSLHDLDEQATFSRKARTQVAGAPVLTALQSAKQQSGGLTRRQREVAVLIAQGCSNRQISDRLSISERTVESHITAILSTLALTSRAQIAAWSVSNGLSEASTTT